MTDYFETTARIDDRMEALARTLLDPVRAEDMGVGFVGADWDVEAAEYFTEWSR